MRYETGQVIDHYEIVEGLGEGAYAEAYKAREVATGRIVMLKSPNPQMFGDPQVYHRFLRESEIARRLDHPGLQHALDLHDEGEPYLVLEYVEGTNLRRRLQAYEGAVPIETALDWGRQLASALAYIHAAGVTHRDLKPENVMIDAEGDLKILDFGTALLTGARRLTWRHLTESVGTPDYMSPEQIQGERGDRRSDVYAWGVMMYEFLTGNVPFEGDNWLAAMAGHLQQDPKSIRHARPEVSSALEAVVLKAMRRYPENRYQSAEDLLADLGRLDTLDASAFDLSPERPMGGMSATKSGWRLWGYIAMIALGFIAALVLVVVVSVVMHL
jgi:serine/threonine-protein kinase